MKSSSVEDRVAEISDIITKLSSPHADMIWVAEDYSNGGLLTGNPGASGIRHDHGGA